MVCECRDNRDRLMDRETGGHVDRQTKRQVDVPECWSCGPAEAAVERDVQLSQDKLNFLSNRLCFNVHNFSRKIYQTKTCFDTNKAREASTALGPVHRCSQLTCVTGVRTTGDVYGGGGRGHGVLPGGLQRIQRHSGALDHNVVDFIAPPPETHGPLVLHLHVTALGGRQGLTWTGPVRSPESL